MNPIVKPILFRASFETANLIIRSRACLHFIEFKKTDIDKLICQMAPTKYIKSNSNNSGNRNRPGIKQYIGKERRRGIWHEHKCRWCKLYYVHLHPMRYPDHSQFKYQCPNEKCIAYHCGRNDTRAYLIDDQVGQRK